MIGAHDALVQASVWASVAKPPRYGPDHPKSMIKGSGRPSKSTNGAFLQAKQPKEDASLGLLNALEGPIVK